MNQIRLMNMKYLCDKKLCTACGACSIICPRKCIKLVENEFGEKKPVIEESNCIHCKLCAKACHMLNKKLDFVKAERVYAAWSEDKATQLHAASGGIASELYKYALYQNIEVMGTKFTRENGVQFKKICSKEDIAWARDSKYVYSNMVDAFEFYESRLNSENRCIFIGLPCQVAAMRTYLTAKGKSLKNILFVDIICHGVPPYRYLDEHIKKIETFVDKPIKKVTFRHKSSFLLKLYTEEDSCVYSKNMNEDLYFRAFVEGLNYRDNCYHCRYSREDRVSDITIGDYSGLGSMAEWEGEKRMVSVILCNSEKGTLCVKKLVDEMRITAIERPCEEPFNDEIGNPQLHHPSEPHLGRLIFLENYKRTMDFDESAYPVLRRELVKYYIMKPIKTMYTIAASMLSKDQKKKIKKLLGITR